MKMLEFIPSYFMEMIKLFLNVIVNTVVSLPQSSKNENIPSKQETSNAKQEDVFVKSEDNINKENTNSPKNITNQRRISGNGQEQKSENSKRFTIGDITINNHNGGDVCNIIGSTNVNIGPTVTESKSEQPQADSKDQQQEQEQDIRKCDLITRLMESDIKPDREDIDFISKNLGTNWYTIFMKLGFSEGVIQSKTIDWKNSGYGVKEVRFQLLLEWFRSDENTLGRLAKLLWNEGRLERGIVKELAQRYYGN